MTIKIMKTGPDFDPIEYVNEIVYGNAVYEVYWNSVTGVVHLTKPSDPAWGNINIGQVAPVRKDQAIEAAMIMLRHGGIR